MMTAIRRVGVAVAAVGLIVQGAGRAEAGVVAFTYSGTNVFPGAAGTTTGGGSFAFADSPTALTLGGLTGFNYVETVTASFGPGQPQQPATFTFGLADLLTFSATLTPGGVLTGLALTTRPGVASNPAFRPETFVVSSLAPGGAATFNDLGQQLTAGTVTAAVPEPSSLAGLGIGGLLGLGYVWGRRRAAWPRPRPAGPRTF